MNRMSSVLEVRVLNLWMSSTLDEIGLTELLPISCPGNLAVRRI